jgi:hypothetical protein
MLEVTYGDVRNPMFKKSFSKVTNSTGFKDIRVVRNIVRIGNLLQKYEEEVQECWIKLLKEYAAVDEKGDFIPNIGPDNQPQAGTYRIKEDCVGEAWDKAVKEFNALKFEVSAERMRLHDLVACNLSPAELSYLEPLLTDLSAEEELPTIKSVPN